MCHFFQKWTNEPRLVLGIKLEENITPGTVLYRYLGLGMRYEAGNCAIVISTNDVLQMMSFNSFFNLGHILSKIALDQRL